MPIYAFRCDACGHAFDRLQKLSDPDPVECPECGAPAVRRQVTAPVFRLAGSGWYETDFKSPDRQRNLAGRDEPAPAADKGRPAGESGAGKAAGSAPPAPKPAPAPASGSAGGAADK